MNSNPQNLTTDAADDVGTRSAERRNLADALAHERNVLRTMIDLIPAFIYAKDAQSRFTAANKLVANRMGVEPEDLIGKTDFDFYPREMAEKFFSDEQTLIKSGKPLIDCEEIAYDKTRGMDRVILTSKMPLRDADGNLTGVVGTGLDIIREGVKELLEHIDALHAAMPQPPVPDENVEDLRKEMPPALTLVADGLSRIAEIVRSMKDFAHADKQEMGPTDLNRAIASTLVIARSEYKPVAEVETDYGQLPPVICHTSQINQVVLNLVVNAAHAIADKIQRSGAVGKITVSTRVEGERVVIAIGDTGGGIPEDIRARIFDPFFTTKEVGRGTGQGLSIARNVIVKGHGGELDFTTELGKGTTFYIRLPISRS